MRGSFTISAIAHVTVLAMCLVAFAAQPLEAPATPSVTVNTISVKDFTELTQGVKDAPKIKIDDIKPLADKIDLPKPADQLAPKVTDKPEIKTDTSAKQTKPDPKPDPKPADKPAKAKPPDYKPDQIADLLKKDASKQPPKPDNKVTPDTPAHDSPKFNADQVAALLDKRDPQRQIASADTLNTQANLGASNVPTAAQLSQSEIDALVKRLTNCWSPPHGIDVSSKVYVVLRVLFKPDASMSREPVLVEATASPLGPALAESAKRALLLCQPFTMLKPEHYDQWKDIELKFDPKIMLAD
jgi:outer membrane biosynthesis protein TonB